MGYTLSSAAYNILNMAEIHNFDESVPHVVVRLIDSVDVISINDIRMISTGQISIAEFDDPEGVAMALAKIAIGAIESE